MAKVKSIKILDKKESVYNLQVRKNHNYFVEGVLVKNSEKPLSAYNICNLLSMNMEMFSINESEYKKELETIVPYLVRLSDNVIEYELQNNLSPVEEQKLILSKTREIGMGITNLHGWLLKNNIQYDSDEAIEKSENFMKWYSYYVFMASVYLGKEKGNAPAFDELKDVSDLMESTYFKNIVNKFFDGDPTKIKSMRNMAHVSIAPTGCQVKSNKIRTNNGNKSLQEILEENDIKWELIENIGISTWIDLKIPLEVEIEKNVYQKVFKIYYNGKTPTRKIQFEDGNEYEFTLNHPLLINENGEEVWKQVKDLKENDDIISIL